MLVKINIGWKIESHLKIVKVIHKHDLSPRQQQQQPGGENGVTMLNSLAYLPIQTQQSLDKEKRKQT